MKTNDRLVEIEKAKTGGKTEVGGLEVFTYDLYQKALVHIVRLDCEVEALQSRVEKLEGKP
jgi:hypothetical protein